MKQNDSHAHPDRTALAAHAQAPDARISRHLEICDDCRLLALVIAATLRNSLIDPSDRVIARLGAIPLLDGVTKTAGERHGRVAFDSWQARTPLSVRATPPGSERRLRLVSDAIILDVVVEQRRSHWDAVYRAYDDNKVVHDAVLQVGRKRLLPDQFGCFRQVSTGPPRQIKLLTPTQVIRWSRLTW